MPVKTTNNAVEAHARRIAAWLMQLRSSRRSGEVNTHDEDEMKGLE